MKGFDAGPVLTGPRLTLRPVTEADRDGLHGAARDPEVWAQHPATTRHRRDVFDPYFDFLLGAGGTLVAVDRDAAAIAGCSRFYAVPGEPEAIGIGFTFLARRYWGGTWNREMKALMLEHAFSQVPLVWFHIAPGNTRSQVATTRLGAEFVGNATMDLGTGPTLTGCYKLTKAGWRDAIASASDRATGV